MSAQSQPQLLTPRRAVALVARREFLAQVQKKSFVISNAIILVAIVGAIVAFSLFSGGDEDRASIGLVGDQALSSTLIATGDAAEYPVEVTEIADEETARTQVKDGDLDVALIPGSGGGVTAVTDSEIDAPLRMVLDSAVAGAAQSDALAAQGVDADELAAATGSAVVTVDAIDPPDPESGQRIALSLSVVGLLYMQILSFGMSVAMGVVEEKSSRVVELLLSTVRPLQLLWGKVIGIGAVGLAQLTAYGVVGVSTGLATDVLTLGGAAWGTLVSTLAWFVLGFAFFAVLYAATGSMVSRQEDINSTTMPLTLLILAMFFASFNSVQNPDGTLSNVLSWVPPFSAILMPLRIAAGVASGTQIVVTAVLMLVVTGALSAVAARIYRRSILRMGKTVSWREALSR